MPTDVPADDPARTGRTSNPGTSTAYAVSPDSGTHWSAEGAWSVAAGIYRIPLPLPMDGLRAINVYVLETDEGLTLIDGGWAIEVAREQLERSLRGIGYGFGDIRRFLVTHAHRDHYTLATTLGSEYAAHISLGAGERPALELLQAMAVPGADRQSPFLRALEGAGAADVAEQWRAHSAGEAPPDPTHWAFPDTWLEGDLQLSVGARILDAVHTPGHTPGHYVFADLEAELLFAGDHVLPTITPSIGFTIPPPAHPLGDFMASLAKVRALPDLRVLPAHGPVAPSTHARVDQLLAHHEGRLAASLAALPGPAAGVGAGAGAGCTAQEVAARLPWTRHEHAYDTLDVFNRGMATMETMAHLELLVAQGRATRDDDTDGGVVFAAAARP